ncbi:MAG: hypothetical protein IM597_21555 [Pseudanabaena sp. M176S2SP2A07QC]|nr:hypothetical protein [Pseudanabaena sp. M176S2SP2A07QC]
MVGAFICFGIAIIAIFLAVTYKPKPTTSRKMSYQEMIAERERLMGKQKTKPRARNVRPAKRNTQSDGNTISIASLETLTRLVGGQREVALRLVEGNRRKFPDKSIDWACEKAISDIERDRHI